MFLIARLNKAEKTSELENMPLQTPKIKNNSPKTKPTNQPNKQ